MSLVGPTQNIQALRAIAMKRPHNGLLSFARFAGAGLNLADRALPLFVYPAAWLLKLLRRAGLHRFPRCQEALLQVGVFPVRNHYYEPQFDCRNLKQPLSQDRELPGINLDTLGQLEFMDSLCYADELENIPQEKSGALDFYLNNGAFEAGDAEYFYQLIRFLKPGRLFEIGSGHSTLMAIKAIQKNREENDSYECRHVCIEPYEMPWLERTGVSVIRQKVEDLAVSFFSDLRANDILFIDSSHVIRPQGDVLFEFLAGC